jgi:hypothetical protein
MVFECDADEGVRGRYESSHIIVKECDMTVNLLVKSALVSWLQYGCFHMSGVVN